MAQEPVRGRDCDVRFAAARRHLNQGPRPIFRERRLEVADRLNLNWPEALLWEWRHLPQTVSKRGRCLTKPCGQHFRPMKLERPATSGLRVQAVREPGLNARALVEKREGNAMPRDSAWEGLTVSFGLDFHSGERRPLRLGLDDTRGLAVEEEKVVRRAPFQRKLSYGHSAPGIQAHGSRVLNDPTRDVEGRINGGPGSLFRSERHETIPVRKLPGFEWPVAA